MKRLFLYLHNFNLFITIYFLPILGIAVSQLFLYLKFICIGVRCCCITKNISILVLWEKKDFDQQGQLLFLQKI